MGGPERFRVVAGAGPALTMGDAIGDIAKKNKLPKNLEGVNASRARLLRHRSDAPITIGPATLARPDALAPRVPSNPRGERSGGYAQGMGAPKRSGGQPNWF